MGRKNRALDVVAAALIATLNVEPEVVATRLQRMVGDDLGAVRQVVEQAVALLEEQRLVILDSSGRDAVTNILIDRTVARVDIKPLTPLLTEAGDRFVGFRMIVEIDAPAPK